MLSKILMFLMVSSTEPIELPIRNTISLTVKGVDRSFEFFQKLESENTSEAFITRLRNSKILIVPGFLSTSLEKLPLLNPATYQDQIKWFKSESIEYEFAPIQSEQPPLANTSRILNSIELSTKPVILLAHSKGGLDSLEALLTASPDLLQKVAGFVALQSPFQGTPMADVFVSRRALRWLAAESLQALGGSLTTVVEMTLFKRQRYLESRHAQILSLLEKIPLVCFSSWKSNELGKVDTSFEVQRNFLLHLGYQTDGLIPWQSAILPGAQYVVMPEIDHSTTVFESSIPLDRVRMTKALLSMLWNH